VAEFGNDFDLDRICAAEKVWDSRATGSLKTRLDQASANPTMECSVFDADHPSDLRKGQEVWLFQRQARPFEGLQHRNLAPAGDADGVQIHPCLNKPGMSTKSRQPANDEGSDCPELQSSSLSFS
jgi:hypothetical protein